MRRICLLFVALCACAGDPVAGPQGPIGQQGQRGEKGDPGAPGPAAGSSGGFYKPRYWVSCVASLDLISVTNGASQRVADGLDETLLDYALTLYSDGDVEVSCSAAIGAQSGAGSHYYPRVTKGADTANCTSSADYTPNSGIAAGFWEYKIQSGPLATYMDADNPLGLDESIYRFTEKDCSSFLLGDDGGWSDVTLSDVF